VITSIDGCSRWASARIVSRSTLYAPLAMEEDIAFALATPAKRSFRKYCIFGTAVLVCYVSAVSTHSSRAERVEAEGLAHVFPIFLLHDSHWAYTPRIAAHQCLLYLHQPPILSRNVALDGSLHLQVNRVHATCSFDVMIHHRGQVGVEDRLIP